MKKIFFLFLLACNITANSYAQNVAINADGSLPNSSAMLDIKSANKGLLIPRVGLTGTTDVTTIPSPATSLLVYNTATAGATPNSVSPGFYYWANASWNRLLTAASTLIPFSSGVVRSGPSVVSYAPLFLGFGSSTTETINGFGESTMPPEAGGFSFIVPASGVIQNLQVSADLLVASLSAINVVGLQYDFTVFVSPSVTNNGLDHPAQPYLTTPLTTSVRFGFPNSILTAGTFRSATNINISPITVNAGDRVGVRVRTLQNTDVSANDINQLSFSASVLYTPAQ